MAYPMASKSTAEIHDAVTHAAMDFDYLVRVHGDQKRGLIENFAERRFKLTTSEGCTAQAKAAAKNARLGAYCPRLQTSRSRQASGDTRWHTRP